MHAIIPPRANELQVLSNKPDVVTIQDRGVHRNHKYQLTHSLTYLLTYLLT